MTPASAAAQAAIPTVKALTGWSPAAVGIWSILLTMLSGIALAVVKAGPSWIKAWSDSRNQDAVAQQKLDDAAEARLQKIEEGLKRSETVAMYLTGATTLTLNALRAVDPQNPAIAQANSLVEMAVAAGGDGVWAKSLAQLANVKGVGE